MAATPRRPHRLPRPQRRPCPKCGATLLPGLRFCNACGASLAPTAAAPGAAASPPVDLRQRVDQDRGVLKRLQLLIPGYRGYRRGRGRPSGRQPPPHPGRRQGPQRARHDGELPLRAVERRTSSPRSRTSAPPLRPPTSRRGDPPRRAGVHGHLPGRADQPAAAGPTLRVRLRIRAAPPTRWTRPSAPLPAAATDPGGGASGGRSSTTARDPGSRAGMRPGRPACRPSRASGSRRAYRGNERW